MWEARQPAIKQMDHSMLSIGVDGLYETPASNSRGGMIDQIASLQCDKDLSLSLGRSRDCRRWYCRVYFQSQIGEWPQFEGSLIW